MTVEQAINVIKNADDIFSIYVAGSYIDGKVVNPNQDEEEHTWYHVATRVFKVEDGFVGVRGPSFIKYRTDTWQDAAEHYGVYAFEVEPVPCTYYKRKYSS